jgi:DNA-binding cell septation regulator SpoVG
MSLKMRKAANMVSALNYYKFDKGSVKGFFDLRYHGMTIKGCRLMSGQNGYWVGLPSDRVEKDGATKYVDRVELTKSEMDHVRRLVIADLEQQGHLKQPAQAKPQTASKPATRPTAPGNGKGRPPWITPDGEDLGNCYAPPEKGDELPW